MTFQNDSVTCCCFGPDLSAMKYCASQYFSNSHEIKVHYNINVFVDLGLHA